MEAISYVDTVSGADSGLICAYRLFPDRPPESVEAGPLAVMSDDSVLWLHFNLSDARARRWLLAADFLPEDLRDVIKENDANRRIELSGTGLLLVLSDFAFDSDDDPSDTAPLWCFAQQRLLLSMRLHPLRSSDELRLQMRGSLTAASGFELISHLLDIRTARLKRLAADMSAQLDDIEDDILAGNIKEQRRQLGRMRRICARLRRQFSPERADMSRLMSRISIVLGVDAQEILQESVDSLGFGVEELAEIYERAKLLQEELASRLAENTGRNLYVLSILTAVLLPMTLVTGIFGMNVAGLPGLESAASFWWVMLLIAASGVFTLAVLFWRRLL
jgi:zinc transporter